MLMHESLVRLENLIVELNSNALLEQIKVSSLVSLMVENVFSLMRKNDAMPTQMSYGTRRATCIRPYKLLYRTEKPLSRQDDCWSSSRG